MSVSAAAVSGSTRQMLEAMRDVLAAAMDDADAAVKAQVSGQLLKVVAAIAALPSEGTSLTDDLAQRRSDRVATARASAPPKRQREQRGG